MTAPDGKIRDIPWERWILAEKGIKEEDSESGTIRFDFNNLCCENQDLKYIKSNKFADLSGIRIECKSCRRKNTLAGLFGLRLPVKAGEKVFFKPVIRTSNSVYYPLIINSIYLPKKDEITNEDKNKINIWISKRKNIDFICEALCDKYTKTEIENYIKIMDEDKKDSFETETLYRQKEYNFLLQNFDFPNNDSNDLNYERIDTTNLSKYGIEHLIKIKRLKLTMVQTGYTRQKPLDKDIFMQEGDKNTKALSHILIKELEFLCGYSSASLGERLYVDNNNMQGVLIYTIAGSEGSYGGLVTQAESEKFEKILSSALFRARDCASDPICYYSNGQGIGGLNYAACYSCALLPETSCEEFNLFLDRRMLIDNDFGFFKSSVSNL